MPTFDTAAVIGTGMMGPGIALTLALGGVRTIILSRTEEGGARGLETARAQARLLHDHGVSADGAALSAVDALTSSSDFDETIRRVDLVVESAPENMEFKQDLFARLDSLAKPDAILTSNTSGLSITAIASKCSRPERVLTTHFWNPPHLMPLVEVVMGEKSTESNALAMRDLLLRRGKVPVVVRKDRPGQLGNRLQMAMVREAVNIVAEGIASAEDVDIAAKTGFGLRLPVYGIFEHQDMVGLDLGSAVLDYVSRDLSNEKGLPPLVREKLASGEIGVKAGKGYYDWSVRDADAVRTLRDRFVLHFLKAQRNGFTS